MVLVPPERAGGPYHEKPGHFSGSAWTGYSVRMCSALSKNQETGRLQHVRCRSDEAAMAFASGRAVLALPLKAVICAVNQIISP